MKKQEPGQKADKWLAEQVLHVLPGKRLDKGGVIGNDIFCECSFLFLQLKDLVFNSVFTDHAVSENIFRLSDPVSTIDRLLFNSWIPPRVNYINIIRSS